MPKNTIKLRFHPLFIVLAILYALFGNLFVFIVYTLTALIHELGHASAAARLGYRSDGITLLPYGALVSGNLDGASPIDEIKIALAGPAVNLFLAVSFVALWWLFPQTYPYTDVAAQANAAIAVINLLPCHKLDGGWALSSLLRLKCDDKAVKIVTKAVGAVFALTFTGAFVYTCSFTPNFTLLFFAFFLTAGVLSKSAEKYVFACREPLNESALKRGVRVCEVAVSEQTSLKDAYGMLAPHVYTVFSVYSLSAPVGKITQNQLCANLSGGALYDKMGELLIRLSAQGDA